MTENERRILRQIRGSDSMELLQGGQVSRSSGIGAEIKQVVGNPNFKAEVTLQISVRYFSNLVAGGALAAVVVPAPGGLQTNPVPLYLFGNIDFAANYARARTALPTGAGWNLGAMKTIRVGQGNMEYQISPLPNAFPVAASILYGVGTVQGGIAVPGDLLFVIPMAGWTGAGAATGTQAEILVHCPNVPYLSLMAALASDLFTINMIRYVVGAAAVDIVQLANQITFISGSLFGRVGGDTLDPNTFITPGTFQPQIADIPITLPMDKNVTLATYITYTVTVPIAFTWTLTVSNVNKVVN